MKVRLVLVITAAVLIRLARCMPQGNNGDTKVLHVDGGGAPGVKSGSAREDYTLRIEKLEKLLNKALAEISAIVCKENTDAEFGTKIAALLDNERRSAEQILADWKESKVGDDDDDDNGGDGDSGYCAYNQLGSIIYGLRGTILEEGATAAAADLSSETRQRIELELAQALAECEAQTCQVSE